MQHNKGENDWMLICVHLPCEGALRILLLSNTGWALFESVYIFIHLLGQCHPVAGQLILDVDLLSLNSFTPFKTFILLMHSLILFMADGCRGSEMTAHTLIICSSGPVTAIMYRSPEGAVF